MVTALYSVFGNLCYAMIPQAVEDGAPSSGLDTKDILYPYDSRGSCVPRAMIAR